MNKLIFDVGVHDGTDSKYFLNYGCKVIGVECNPFMITILNKTICNNENFTLDGRCISDKDNEYISFYISSESIWSSCNKEIAERVNPSIEIKVKTVTLQTLFDEYGVTDYCKIDIEGNDIIALQSIKDKPKYISCETECLGKTGEGNYYDVFEQLHKLGYTKFILENQNLCEDKMTLPWMLSNWEDYETIKEKLYNLRMNVNLIHPWDFWYDIYATY